MKTLGERGFTLIELLIVVAILGILGAVLFVAIGTHPSMEARDVRRVADINQLQVALALYQKEYGAYPDTLQGLTQADPPIISNVPTDSLGQPYLYAIRSDKESYHLGAVIENPQPLSYLRNDADFNSLNPPNGEIWTNGFDGHDLDSGGTRNVYDVHL